MEESRIRGKTQDELLASYPDLKSKFDLVESVLSNKGTVYYHQPCHTLISVYGLRGIRIEFLDTKIKVQKEGIIQLDPSIDLLEDVKQPLILTETKLENYLPDTKKRSASARFPYQSYLQHLKELTLSGKYYFHSAQGRNFIVTCTGSNSDYDPLYRIYEIKVQLSKPLELGRPVPIYSYVQ